MVNLTRLEKIFKKHIGSLQNLPDEMIVKVDLDLLHKFNLLDEIKNQEPDSKLTQYFHVIESSEKITLINDKFVVWVVPQKKEGQTCTCTLIALHDKKGTPLELVFINEGVYNNSKLVLRVLEKFLFEIEENEDFLEKLA